MSSTSIKKPLIGLIFLLFICLSVPLGAVAGESHNLRVAPGERGVRYEFSLVLCAPNCNPIGGALTWGLSPNNGTATLSTPSETDNEGGAWFELRFHENACGTYTVTVRLTRDPRPTSNIKFILSGKPPCSTGSSSGATEPRKLFIVSGDNQTGIIGEPLADPFVVRVRDREQDNKPLEGVKVTFTVLTGGGSLSTTTTITDQDGLAKSTLTLGNEPGTNTVEARAEGVSKVVTFSAEATLLSPTPTRLSIISGDNQEGLTGEALTNPFVTEVRDQHGDPMEGVTVTFAVTAGDGSLSATTATTDQAGQAETTLTLGTEPGTNTVEANVEGIAQTVTFNTEATLPPPTPTSLSIISGDNQKGFTGEPLAPPFIVQVHDQYGNPMEGVTVIFAVTAGDSTLSATVVTTNANGEARSTLILGTEPGTNTVQASVEGIAQTATFNAIAELLEFNLSLSIGLNLIHLPLRVRAVDGMPATIQSVSELYNALGGADAVNYLITHDSQAQTWHGYFGDADRGTTADRRLTDQTGILANMIAPVSVRLSGDALGADGSSTITLNQGINLVGLPLKDSRVTRVSDLFVLNGIGGNIPVIILSDGGRFQSVGRVGDPGDIEITGGQAFIMTAQRAAMVDISGDAWTNSSETAAAPLMSLKGIKAADVTPVLGLRGSIVHERTGVYQAGFRVTVKNLSTDKNVATATTDNQMGYRLTVVDLETGHAATVGDIFEISAQSPNPFVGVKPLRYTVTTEDMKWSQIQLPTLVAYERPVETELLHNYPNPFNPETWIPYRLAEDAFVTLTIYGGSGKVVRTLDVGYRIASAYTRVARRQSTGMEEMMSVSRWQVACTSIP